MINKGKRPKLDLLIKLKNPLLSSTISHGTDRIKKEISDLNKDFTKDGVPSGKFRNRPVLNMARKNFDFSARNLVSNPYPSGRHYHGGNKRKRKNYSINAYFKPQVGVLLNQKDNNEFDYFMREMNTLKKRILFSKTQIEIK